MADRSEVQYQVNWLLLAISAAVVLLVGGGAFLIHKWQLSHLSTTMLSRAEELSGQKQYQDAYKLLQQYTRLRPDDPNGRVLAATVFDKGGQEVGPRGKAIQLYYQALGLLPDRIDLRQRLAELLLT